MEVTKINSLAAVTDAAPGQNGLKFQISPELARAVTAVNAAKLFGQDSELTFAMDRETRRVVIRLMDRKSHQLIRQIPSESLLRMAEDVTGGNG